MANGIDGNAFLAVAQIANPEEMGRINHAVNLEMESAPDQWAKAEGKILTERIKDPLTASLQLVLLPATTDPSRFDDQTKLINGCRNALSRSSCRGCHVSKQTLSR